MISFQCTKTKYWHGDFAPIIVINSQITQGLNFADFRKDKTSQEKENSNTFIIKPTSNAMLWIENNKEVYLSPFFPSGTL